MYPKKISPIRGGRTDGCTDGRTFETGFIR